MIGAAAFSQFHVGNWASALDTAKKKLRLVHAFLPTEKQNWCKNKILFTIVSHQSFFNKKRSECPFR